MGASRSWRSWTVGYALSATRSSPSWAWAASARPPWPYTWPESIAENGETGDAIEATADRGRTLTQVLWRSLVNAPPLSEVLSDWLQALSRGDSPVPDGSIEAQVDRLVGRLVKQPTLLVLDNLESILDQEARTGQLRPGYEDYAYLLQAIAERDHRSCLLITSREEPRLLSRLQRAKWDVTKLRLAGLPNAAGRQLFQHWSLQGDDAALNQLNERYSGNPLALELVSETIDELYAGEVAAFLALPFAIFDDIEAVLRQQIDRLTDLEQRLLFWLAVEREPRSVSELHHNLIAGESQQAVLVAMRRLHQRSLADRLEADGQARFFLQNVVTEYLTDRLVRAVCREIVAGEVALLDSHALLKATAEPYVVESQKRMLLRPVTRRLRERYGLENLGLRYRDLVAGLRRSPTLGRGYAAGNLLNLMLHADLDVQGMDFAGLTLRRVHLQDVRLPEVNLSRTTLKGCRFTQYQMPIRSLTQSPDGRFLASVTTSGELLIWQRDGQMSVSHQVAPVDCWSVAYSPDGGLLAVASADGCIRLLRVDESDQGIRLVQIENLKGHDRIARSVRFRPDGRQLASAGADSTVHLWRVDRIEGGDAQLHPERTLTGHTDRLFRAVYSPDGRLLASCGADCTIRIWDSYTGACLWILRGHTERISDLAFAPDGVLLASASIDASVRLWHMGRGVCTRVLDDHGAPLLAVAFSHNGRLLASVGLNATVQLWETETWQPVRQLPVVSNARTEICSLIFDPGTTTFLCAGDQMPVQEWDVRSGRLALLLHGWSARLITAAFHPSGRWIAAGGLDGRLSLWETDALAAQASALTYQAHRKRLGDIAFSPDGSWLVTGSDEGTLRVWRQQVEESGARLASHQILSGRMDSVSRLQITPDGRLLLAGSRSGELWIWPLTEDGTIQPQPLHRIAAHKQGLWGLALHPQGHQAATSGGDPFVRLWDIRSGALAGEFAASEAWFIQVDISPDGKRLVTTDIDDSLLAWQIRDGRVSHCRRFDTGTLFAVKVVGNDRIATGNMDGSVSMWRLEADGTIPCLWQRAGYSTKIEALALNPDRSVLASVGTDGTLCLWDVDSGEPLAVRRNLGPYAGTNIRGIQGLTEAQRHNLLALGAVDEIEQPSGLSRRLGR